MRSISMFTGATRASPCSPGAAFDKAHEKIGLKTGRTKAAPYDSDVGGAMAVAISAA